MGVSGAGAVVRFPVIPQCLLYARRVVDLFRRGSLVGGILIARSGDNYSILSSQTRATSSNAFLFRLLHTGGSRHGSGSPGSGKGVPPRARARTTTTTGATAAREQQLPLRRSSATGSPAPPGYARFSRLNGRLITSAFVLLPFLFTPY